MIIVQNAHTVKPLHFSESHRYSVDDPKIVLEVAKLFSRLVLSTDYNGVSFFFKEYKNILKIKILKLDNNGENHIFSNKMSLFMRISAKYIQLSTRI